MDEPIDEDDIDMEELQAQIDLEMAHTRSLVASWVDSQNALSAAEEKESHVDQEKEIQELLRRPPRLGVGASVPAGTGVLGREAVKLRGKLAGKKRPREEPGTQPLDQGDEEEESRAGAIKKKPRIDPFEGKGKKKARKPANTPSAPPALSSSTKATTKAQKGAAIAGPSNGTQPSSPKTGKVASPSSAPEVQELLHSQTPIVTGKKKKKRKKAGAITQTPGAPPARVKDHSPEVVEVIMVKDGPPRSTGRAALSIDLTLRTPSPPPRKASILNHDLNPLEDNLTLFGVPLLNLDGPPPTSEPGSPSRKKRRRRRKKKLDQKGHGDAMDVDADAKEDPVKPRDTSEDDD